MNARHALLILALALPFNGIAQAATIEVPNFSFEAIPAGDDNQAMADIPDWQSIREPDTNTISATFNPGTEFDNARGGGTPRGALGPQVAVCASGRSIRSQKPLTTIQAGTTYTLTIAIGDDRLSEPGVINVGFLIDDQFVEGSSETFDASDFAPEGRFEEYAISYTATAQDAGKTLKISLGKTAEGGTDQAVHFDNVRLSDSL
jgi:hypothetical protein